jgi:nucleoside-triphosphatase THEP1
MASDSPFLPPPLPPGAVLYTRDTEDRGLLARFAAELVRRGFRVGGVVQEVLRDSSGAKIGVDVVEIDSGRRIPIARPTAAQIAEGVCSLDLAGLAESTGPVRRALDQGADLIVVEKFGDQERANKGLAGEIMAAMAEGIPTLVAVPAGSLDDWQRFSGNLGVLLPHDEEALWRWWGPHRLYRDLVLALGEDAGPIRRIVMGKEWLMVEGPHGCGLAPAPRAFVGDLDGWIGRPLREAAERVPSWDPADMALGIAALNAHFNRFDLPRPADEDILPFGLEAPAVRIGAPEGLGSDRFAARVAAGHAGAGELPRAAAHWVLPGAGSAVLASLALVDLTLPGLVRSRQPGTLLALAGAATPMTARLHAHGFRRLQGVVVTRADAAAEAILAGASWPALAPFTRPVALSA